MPSGPQADAGRSVVPLSGGRTASRRSVMPAEFQFGAGALCLDFTRTLSGRGQDAVELLASPEHLGRWLTGPGLPAPTGGLTEDDLAAARALRGSIDAAARAVIAGTDADASDVRRINVHARCSTPVFQLRAGGREHVMLEEADISAALAVIARDAVHLLGAPEAGRLRECQRPGCLMLFCDRSPSGRRRWCSMKGCGERVAAASYRQRRATAAG